MRETEQLAADVVQGKRRSLAKAITLVESSRREQEDEAENLLQALIPHSGKSLRIGISGVPGVGKSTFIERFGLKLANAGKKIAVLAIDPSSPLSGGSIMGDRTRMPDLSAHQNAFIRPSPSGESSGGVARRTRESILLCEAAGYDIVLVETVGVGQGEYLVASMVDLFIIIHLPNSGDELQGIKKGILELADAVVVTKADGDNVGPAKLAKQQLQQSLQISRGSNHQVPVLLTSCLEQLGIDEFVKTISDLQTERMKTNLWQTKRIEQSISWYQNEINHQLLKAALDDSHFRANYERELDLVRHGKVAASVAARRLVAKAFRLTTAISQLP